MIPRVPHKSHHLVLRLCIELGKKEKENKKERKETGWVKGKINISESYFCDAQRSSLALGNFRAR